MTFPAEPSLPFPGRLQIEWRWTEAGRVWTCPDCLRSNGHELVPVGRCRSCGAGFRAIPGDVDDRRRFVDSCAHVSYGFTRISLGEDGQLEVRVLGPLEADEGEG